MRQNELAGILLHSPAMRRAYELCQLYARVDRPIVFVGPVGSGKTALAETVHRNSSRPGRFVAIGSGELSKDLSLDTLFGHVAGAFTGATHRRQGLVAEASQGTLLLDDLALMPTNVQSEILRLMESRRFRPLGSVEDQLASCRILYATTVDPDELVDSGRLLPDLASRLGEFHVRVPPLSSRREDILPLSMQRAQRMIAEQGWRAIPRFENTALHGLLAYHWPGNVRELHSVVEFGVIHAGPHDGFVEIHAAHLPERFRETPCERSTSSLSVDLVNAALRRNGGNKSAAARELRVHRNTILKYERLGQKGA